MFAKYGAAASTWTVLSQIATVTTPRSTDGSSSDQDQEESPDQDLDRAEFEGMFGDMMVELEAKGLSGGPVWPTITMSPIAVYRSTRSS